MRALALAVALLLVAGGARADDTTDQRRRDALAAATLGGILDAADQGPLLRGRAEVDLAGELRYDHGARFPSYGALTPSFWLTAASSRVSWISATSRLALSAPFGLDGSHLVAARVGTNEDTRGGVEIGLRYRVDHATDPTPARGAIDVGRGPFVDQGGRLTFEGRLPNPGLAIGFPSLHYDYRRVDSWATPDRAADGPGGLQSHGGGLGISILGADKTGGCLQCEIAGVTAKLTTFQSGRTAAAAEAELLHLDAGIPIGKGADRMLRIVMTPTLSFLWTQARQIKTPFFDGKLAIGYFVRDRGSFSSSISYAPAWTPDGMHLARQLRAEVAATSQNLGYGPLGGTVAGSLDRLDRVAVFGDKPGAVYRMTGHVEGFLRLVPGGRVGLSYEVQEGPLRGAIFDGKTEIGHVAQAFVRIGESF